MEGFDDAARKIIMACVLFSCVVGSVVAAYFIYDAVQEDDYVELYLEPGSYSNYLESDTVTFTYGIKQYGARSSRYVVEVYLGEILIATRDLSKRTGENEVEIEVPKEIEFPVKVSLVLKTDLGVNEVHFWLKGRREENGN